MSMQLDRYLHHLTPRGWVAGTESMDGITHCENPKDGTGQLKLHSHAGWYDFTLEPANPLPLRCEDSSPHVPGSHLRRWQ